MSMWADFFKDIPSQTDYNNAQTPEPKDLNTAPQTMQNLREINNNIPDYKPPLLDTLKNDVQSGAQNVFGGVKWYGTHPGQFVNEVGQGIGSELSKLTTRNSANINNINATSPFEPLANFGKQSQTELQAQQDYNNAHPITTVPGMIGQQIPEIPLWMTGEGALTKLASKIPIVGKVASRLPDFVNGGLKDATTYGAVVAPAEAIANGDNAQQFLNREKQIPTVFLGGSALRGIGAGAGAIKGAIKGPELPPLENNPLLDVQNAYRVNTPNDLNTVKTQLPTNPTLGIPQVTPKVDIPQVSPRTWTNQDQLSAREVQFNPLNVPNKAPQIESPNVSSSSESNIFKDATAKIETPTESNSYTLQQGGNPQALNTGTRPSLDFSIMKNDKLTSKDIRQAYSGVYNEQRLNGAQLADQVAKLAPKEQEALTFYTEAGGDKKLLQEWANNPDPKLDPYRQNIQQALNLSSEAQKAYVEVIKPYYDKAGQSALGLGTIKDVRSNYINRVWKQHPASDFVAEQNRAELLPGEQVKGRIDNGPSSDLNPFSKHAQQRYYENLVQGIQAGEQPSTLKAGDLIQVHSEELARANATRMLADSVVKNKIGTFVEQGSRIDPGFSKVADFGGKALILPDGIAKGLKAILEPNYIKKIDGFRKLQAYQGVIKSIDLSYSAFHHITMAFQMVYQSALHPVQLVKTIYELPRVLQSGEFNQIEKDFVGHTGMTSKVESNQDILRKLVGSQNKIADKITNLPIVKQALGISEKNNEFLFGKIQRYLKVMDYQNKVTNYLGKNANVNDAQLMLAKRSIAKEVNAAYGGLNWQALGVTPSVQSVLRLGFLAPDWTLSNVALLKYAGEKSVGGSLARQHLIGALIGGAVFTEGLNHLLTGHFTDKNAKGHEMEVEIQPGVYFSFFRGGIGDITKWAADMGQSGPIGGSARFFQGKLSPLARTGVGLASNTNYFGGKIYDTTKGPLQNTLSTGKYMASNLVPIPFGWNTTSQYANSGKATLPGMIPTALGLTRFSKTQDPSIFTNPKDAYSGNWLNDLLSPSNNASDSLINKINDSNKTRSNNSQKANEELGKALLNGGSTANIFSKYSIPTSQQKTILTDAKNKLKLKQVSPLAKKYMSMSKENQKLFMNSLSSSERATLQSELQP